MTVISNHSFKVPIVATDPVTKGTFTITWAMILLDYDWDEEEVKSTRATGSIVIGGFDNPLFDALKEHPLRIQGLVASALFCNEKKFIQIKQITDYNVIDDGIVKEIELSLLFDIIDNLAYLEQVIEYKDQNKL